MRKLILVLPWMLVVGVLLSPVVAAEPVNISATQLGRWDPVQRLFYVTGDVEVTIDDLILRGNQLLWDVEQHQMTLEGNVELEENEQLMMGESLVYNTKTAQGEFNQVHSTIESESIAGPIFVFGETVSLDGEDYFVHSGRLTTCDLDQPHYHLSVKSIDVYPGNKAVIRNVTYYESKIPLFYWPYLAIPLDGKLENITFPEVGYSVEDGYYIKNRYNYYWSQNAYGTLLYDYYTKKGPGLGFDHNYASSMLGDGLLALYVMPWAAGRDLVAQFKHTYTNGNLNLSTNNSYTQTLKDDVLNITQNNHASMSYHNDRLRLGGSFTYLDRQGSSEEHAWSLAGNWNQTLLPNLTLSAYSNVRSNLKERIYDHQISTDYRIGDHNLGVAIQQKYNPDLLDEEAKPSWSSVNRLPEVTWKWQNPGWADHRLNGKFELSIGNFTEFPSNIQSFRLLPRLDLNTRSWRSDFGTTLTYGGGVAGYFYQEGQSQQTASVRLSLTQRFTPQINLSTTYNKQQVWGDTPFKFDGQRPQDALSGTLGFNFQPLSFSFTTGYNFVDNRYNDLVSRINFNHNALRISTSLYYNLNTKTFANLIGSVNYTPSNDLQLRLNARYNIGNQELQRIDGRIAMELTDTVKISYDLIYEPTKANKFTKGEFALTWDLHCRELSFRYNQRRQEFSVRYSINAFPKLPLGYSTVEGLSIFEIEDLQETLGLE